MRTATFMPMFVCILISQFTSWGASARQIDYAYLTNFYFDHVSVSSTGLTFQFKQAGSRFFYSINDGELKKGNYGEIFSIAVGNKLTIAARDVEFVLSPLPSVYRNNGFDIKESWHAFSVGGNLETSRVFMVISPKRNQNQKDAGPSALHFVEPTEEAVRQVLQEKERDK